MLDPERLAGERVDRGAVGGAVVGHQPLDPDAEAGEVSDGTAEEADRGGGLLIVEHLDVDEPGRVVDRDVDVLPADPAASRPAVAVDAVARPADPGRASSRRRGRARPGSSSRTGSAARAARVARACRARSESRSPKPSRPASSAPRRSRRQSAAAGAAPRSPRHAPRLSAKAPTRAPSNDPTNPARPRPGSAEATSRPCARSRPQPRPPPSASNHPAQPDRPRDDGCADTSSR
jgi:hypothetical protein